VYDIEAEFLYPLLKKTFASVISSGLAILQNQTCARNKVLYIYLTNDDDDDEAGFGKNR